MIDIKEVLEVGKTFVHIKSGDNLIDGNKIYGQAISGGQIVLYKGFQSISMNEFIPQSMFLIAVLDIESLKMVTNQKFMLKMKGVVPILDGHASRELFLMAKAYVIEVKRLELINCIDELMNSVKADAIKYRLELKRLRAKADINRLIYTTKNKNDFTDVNIEEHITSIFNDVYSKVEIRSKSVPKLTIHSLLNILISKEHKTDFLEEYNRKAYIKSPEYIRSVKDMLTEELLCELAEHELSKFKKILSEINCVQAKGKKVYMVVPSNPLFKRKIKVAHYCTSSQIFVQPDKCSEDYGDILVRGTKMGVPILVPLKNISTIEFNEVTLYTSGNN